MKIKIVDAALVADKALDLYASRVMKFNRTSKSANIRSFRTKTVIFRIIEHIFDRMYDDYGKMYDKIVICVGCFPLMRMKAVPSLMTRYVCKHSAYLRENGISSPKFLEYFEKFIQSICKSEKTEYKKTNLVFLKEKYTFVSDWVSMFTANYGKTIIDVDEFDVFSNNPRFISSMESHSDLFSEIPSDIRYKDEFIVKSV